MPISRSARLILVHLLLLFWLGCPLLCLANDTIRIVSRNDANALYAIGLVKLGLSKIPHEYELDISEDKLSGERQKRSLMEGAIDIAWAATNIEMETGTLPVRVPLYKGLLGFRVLLIHSDNTRLFSQVNSKSDLERFKFGQGRGWPDSEILAANGLKVVLATKYESLFYMTDGKRFDAFPRGINEPWGEIRQRPNLELAVDNRVLLVYRMPFYLFVTPGRKQLASDLQTGLLLAIEDGSFDAYFYQSPTVKDVLQKVDFSGRRVIELNNPGLPTQTPVEQSNLWVTLEQLRGGS